MRRRLVRTAARAFAAAGAGGTVLAVLAVLGTLTVSAPAAAGREDAGGHGVALRVATYNIHAGAGADGRLDLARTAATLRGLDADVIGLQEVDRHWSSRSDWRDQARDLADALGMRVFFAPIYSLDPPTDDAPRRGFGLAVLSRLALVHAENHEITRLSTQSPDPEPEPAPGFPEVVVTIRGVRVHVYATHLDYRSDPAIRAMQVEDTRRVLAADGPAARQVLVGDLNAPPHADELAPLWCDLSDVWTVVGLGRGSTYPAPAPTKRIDYIAVSPAVTPVRSRVAVSSASDHRPVVADLVVGRDR
jgi:endonuclease/exonuclease/phosphatase family metal-dependent hydrolase